MTGKAECKMDYVKDSKGEEMLLKEGKFQVMMEWEKPYMEACIDALQPFGDVLEIGFGCGYSASHIQTYFPKSHTIVEFHPLVIEKAKRWASHYTNIHLVENTWQEALSSLGLFDAIFFDDKSIGLKDFKTIEESIAHSEEKLFFFLEECLMHHMRKGSRFSCFLNDPASKFEDKVWFDKIITNPFLDYEERRIPVEVPSHCDYYSAKEALVITITKK